jgi:Mg-chelatase subunit ChlD
MNPKCLDRTRTRISRSAWTPRPSLMTRPQAAQILGRRLLALLALGAVTVSLAGPVARPVAAAPATQGGDPAYNYKLVDTWQNEPWALTAGRFGLVGDISSAPDRTIYVLDTQHKAVHAMAPDGRPLRVFKLDRLTDTSGKILGEWAPRRLDVGFDGLPYVLLDGRYIEDGQVKTLARVDRLSTDGAILHSFEIAVDKLSPPRQGSYFDLALRRDGRVYLSRSAVNAFIQFAGCDPATGEIDIPDAGVDVFSPIGDYQATISFHEHGSVPFSLDVDADDTIYVVNSVPAVLFNPYCGPQPTAEPSGIRGDVEGGSGDGADQEPEQWVSGVAIFRPDHSLREIVPFNNAEDIAVGPAGVFVSRNIEIFQLRDGVPMYVGPTGGRVYAAYFGRIVNFLDATADGRVLSGFAHCFWQGVMMFNHPERRQDVPLFAGSTDAPNLEGPQFPVRLDASEELAVLQGRFNAYGLPPSQTIVATTQVILPQTVQRWTRHGQMSMASPLQSQVGMCAGGRTWFTRDVAIDGKDIYTVDFGQLHRRPDDFLPAWTAWPGVINDPDAPSRLAAVSADGGRVAVLDEGTAKVHVLDKDAGEVAAWEIGSGGNSIPVDIALHGDQVYLADRGRNRVSVRGLDGSVIADWATHDGPVSVAVGPTGDVFVLGRGRWGFRYTEAGKLLAAWPMPDRTLWPLDLGVDDDGKVYISFIEPEEYPGIPSSPSAVTNAFRIVQSGIWIFDGLPYEREVVPPPAPDACVATPDKWAAPRRIPLGDTVDVTLTVEGQCPGKQEHVQVALVFDTSRSMSFQDAIDRAKDAVSALLGELSPLTAEVALVTFDEGATLEQPLTNDIGLVRTLVAALDANGDTRSTAGLSTAIGEMSGVRAKPGVRKMILLVTDGVLKDDPQNEAAMARAAGIDLYALVLPTNEYQIENRDQMELLIGDPAHVFTEPDPAQIVELAHGMTNYRPEPGLFETITIRDVIPRNMKYIVGSAKPAAAFDAAANVLTWTLSNIAAADKITLTYKLEPLEIGIWPTNVEATASYRDALGNDGRLVFPIPEVEVYGGQPPETFTVYLPFGVSRVCFPVEKPLDIVLVLDTSSSMREPAAGGQGTKLDAAREAARSFLGNLKFGRDRAGIVAFNIAATEVVPLTESSEALQTGLDSLVSVEGTRIDLGLAEAVGSLATGGRPVAKPVVILLTDGLQNQERAPNAAVLAEAQRLKDRGALVYTIGLGNEIDQELLGQVATSEDRFYRSPTTDDLARIYAQISERITCDLREPVVR